MLEGLLLPVILAIITGGGIGSWLVYKIAKRKVPAELDSIAVQSSETANVSLARTLEVTEKDRDRAWQEVTKRDAVIAAKDARIAALEGRVETLQGMIDTLRDDVRALRNAGG